MKMKKTAAFGVGSFAVLLFFFATAITVISALSPEQIGLIEKHIYTQFMPNGRVPGMSISIVQDGQVVYADGHGYASREKGWLATNETLFAVGSLSKMLCALYIVHMLNEKFDWLGEGVLDTPIRHLAPDFDLVMSDRYRTESITFRDILSHRVCIVDTAGLRLYDISGGANKSEMLYQRRYAPEYCHFRNIQISYSNVMIAVAGEAAAAVDGSGASFEELAVAFFRQIGMQDMRFIQDSDEYENAPNFAHPYYLRDGVLNPVNPELMKYISSIPAGGGVLTSSRDMAAFMNLIINKGAVNGDQIVREEVISWILRVNTPYRFESYRTEPGNNIAGQLGYGLGMFLNVNDGYQMVGHEGYVAPYSTLVNIIPALKAGIFTTASGIFPDHYGLHAKVQEAAYGKSFLSPQLVMRESDLLAPQEEFHRQQRARAASVDALTPANTRALNHSELVGLYGEVLVGDFRITDVSETTLYFKMGRWATGFLRQRAETPAIYDLEFDSDLPQMFFTDPWLDELPNIYVDFSEVVEGIARLSYGGWDFWFRKGWSIDQAPVIPWAPDSCGPRNSVLKFGWV